MSPVHAVTQVEIADLILSYAVCGGREGTAVTSADRDTPTYLDCQSAADAISQMLREKGKVPTHHEMAVLILRHALLEGRRQIDPSEAPNDPDYPDCLAAADAVAALLRGEDPHDR